ncbi:hypothetical protein [Puia dinghuensis]|uniref:Lipocalin-like domain-containing protein n=1 Tax=Puia dinghuensis TaxID=1792502 RepID=A0A8J2UJG2_9BACT|nr:hypothetical protein [Puia dinghuensis]GGB25273.1 hypothetical protein GCM10011511_56550 [Puia dinghuensis]
MLKTLSFSSLLVLALVIVSCHKSNVGGNSAQLVGNYQFLYLSAQVQSISQASGGGQTQKAVTYSNYKTTQNTGTVTLTADSLASKGVGYTAAFTSLTYEYVNGVLTDSISFPFSLTYPPSSTSTKYDVIGQDSIYFHGGYLVSGFGGGSTLAPPSGGHFSFKGDTLFITSHVNQTTPPQNSGGISVTGSESGVATIALLKH